MRIVKVRNSESLHPVLKYYQLLPETGRVSVSIPPQAPGTVMRFTCSMGMYTGQIVFQG